MSSDATTTASPLRDLDNDSPVDWPLIVGNVQRSTGRNGSEYLRLTVSDRTTRLPAVMWEPSNAAGSGPLLRVVGKVADHPRYGRQVIVSELLEINAYDVDLSLLLAGPAESPAALVERLDEMLLGIEDKAIQALLQQLLGPDGEVRARFVRATAAKYNHHAYPGGLLEHSLQVADGALAIASHHPAIDRDLAVAGALLHDIGKLDSYEDDPLAPEFTDAGRLEGEIPLGYYRVRRAIDCRPEIAADRARALLHIVLSHHGLLEHGSPVVPSTREAVVVHAMDQISSRLGAFDRLEREGADGDAWSRYDRVLETAAWIPGHADPAETAEASV